MRKNEKGRSKSYLIIMFKDYKMLYFSFFRSTIPILSKVEQISAILVRLPLKEKKPSCMWILRKWMSPQNLMRIQRQWRLSNIGRVHYTSTSIDLILIWSTFVGSPKIKFGNDFLTTCKWFHTSFSSHIQLFMNTHIWKVRIFMLFAYLCIRWCYLS